MITVNKRKIKKDIKKIKKSMKKNLKLVGLSKKDQLIMAIKKGEIDIDKYYEFFDQYF